MSGGYFNDNGYIYYRVHEFADQLENALDNNQNPDRFFYPKGEEVTIKLRELVPKVRHLSQVMRHIDYLYSGDHGEDSFLQALNKLEESVAQSKAD